MDDQTRKIASIAMLHAGYHFDKIIYLIDGDYKPYTMRGLLDAIREQAQAGSDGCKKAFKEI